MTLPAQSRAPAHFERLYTENPDPWQFATSAYECSKYQATIASLGCRRFKRGIEIGCSIGVLTLMLAGHCDRLVGIDPVAAALTQARTRCARFDHVEFNQMHVPETLPDGRFDLMVFSEVLYFLAPADLTKLVTWTVDALNPGGIALLVNYTGRDGEPASGDPLTGDEAAECFIARAGSHLAPTLHQRAPLYRIDRLRRNR